MLNSKIEETDSIPKKSLLELAEISILLDSYNDIFSDFDPSPFSERILSDDFIVQAKKFSKDKGGNKMSLKLLLPASARNEQDEKIIIKRLHSHFKDIYQQLADDRRRTNIKGAVLIGIGITFMMIASYLSFMKIEKFHAHFLLVLFEPAGWFLLWVGLDYLVFLSRSTKKDIEFYAKMVKSEIKFYTY